jgi:cytoskeleton protein RodZ
MLSVGETLKRARKSQGLDLATVAARTKISAKYLEAIESDDRKLLPSGFFYRSFVEQYAKVLSLDTQAIDAEIDRVLSADAPLPLPGFESVVARNVPSMNSAHRFRTSMSYGSAVTLLVVLAGCSGIYTWWHTSPMSFDLKGIIDKGVIEKVRALGNQSTAQAVNQRVSAPRVVSKQVPVSKPEPATQSAPTPVVAPPVADEPSAKPVGTSENFTEASERKVLLDLLARESTWLSVSSDGKPVFSGMLRAHETKTVSGRQSAKLRVGNAAGIEVRLNGRLLGPLGARGQALTVLFTPDNFQVFGPPKESD